MAKDPALLFYYDTWLTATAGMDADARGWYLQLLIHQYDKIYLPNNIEELALLAGVKISDYERFKQVFEQVFEQRFEQTPDKKWLQNPFMSEILKKREAFIDKRTISGKLSWFLRYAKKKWKIDKKMADFIKANKEVLRNVDMKNEQVLVQVYEQEFKQKSELLLNGDGNKDIVIVYPFTSNNFMIIWDKWIAYKKEQFNFTYKPIGLQTTLNELSKLSGYSEKKAIELIDYAISHSWQGFYPMEKQTVKESETPKAEKL